MGEQSQLLQFVKENEIEVVNYKIIDIEGKLKTISVPASNLTLKKLEEGYGFDGSNYGYAPVENSDMVFKGDFTTVHQEIFSDFKVVSLYANVYQVTSEGDILFNQYPPNILTEVCDLYKRKKIADKIWFLPELEFYLFDKVDFSSAPDHSYYYIESEAGNFPTLTYDGYQMDNGYHAAQPLDRYFDFRNELMLLAQKEGITTKYHHHEVGPTGQLELELEGDDVLKQAHHVIELKYLIKNLSLKYGKTATFMPKPLPGYPGSGLHVHIKLLKEGKNIFYDKDSQILNLSKTALYFIGGILKHSSSLLAFTNPSINSYKRLVKGYEAPIAKTFGSANRTSAIRIPAYAQSENDKRMEFRPQDATVNPYFSFAAILLAGLDGIINKIDPVQEGYGPLEGNVYSENKKVEYLPSSLKEAIEALKNDNEYLKRAFPKELIEQWISLKEKEIKDYESLIITPWEYKKYYSC